MDLYIQYLTSVAFNKAVLRWLIHNRVSQDDTGKLNTAGPIQERVETLLVTSYYRNQGKLRPDGPLCSYGDVSLFTRYSAR